MRRYGATGIFLACLLPVLDHLISIPAGILRMPFGKFSPYTVAGAGVRCAVLSVSSARFSAPVMREWSATAAG